MSRPRDRPGRDRDRVLLTFVVDSDAYGGAEAYVAHLVRGLPDRFSPLLLATPRVPERLREEARQAGAGVVPIPVVRGKLDAGGIWETARVLRRTAADLVHVNLTTAANNRHALGLLALGRTPSVATLHSVAPITSGLQRALLRRVYGRLSRLVAVADEERRQLCEELGLPRSTVELVVNGVEARDRVALRERPEPLRIGCVGRLAPEKGFDVLVAAIGALVAEGVPVELVLAGTGSELGRLRRQADGLPVRVLGWVEDRDAFLASLDVFCLPSRWEGLPFALLEAMMAGLPCVASDVGDIREALGSAGIVVPSGDVCALAGALRGLARSPERRLALGAAAHERAAERYSVARMVADTVAVYDQLVAGARFVKGH